MRRVVLILLLICMNVWGFSNALKDDEFYLVDLEVNNISDNEIKFIDSCLHIFHNSKVDTIKFKAVNYIVEESWNEKIWVKYNYWIYENIQSHLINNNNSSQKYFKTLYAGCLINTGYYFRVIGEIDSALLFYEKSLKAYSELDVKEGIAYCFNNMGVIYDNQGNLEKALECYHGSLKIQEEIKDDEGIANSLSNIGEVHRTQGEFEKALEYFHRSLTIQKRIINSRGEALTLIKIGDVYREDEKYEKAIDYFNNALRIFRNIESNSGIASALKEIGTIHNLKKDYVVALKYFNQSKILQEEIGDKEELAKGYNNLSVVYLNLDQEKEAKKYGLKAFELAKQLGFTEVISSTANALSSVYEKENNLSGALKMFKLHIFMRDSIHNAKNEKVAIRRQIQYDYDNQQALNDKEHENQILLDQKEIEKQKVIKYSVVFMLIVVVLFLLFVFNRLRITRKQKIIILETNEELNQTNDVLAAQRDEIENQKDAIEEQKNIVENKNKEITDSISYAKRIQQAILPSHEIMKALLPNSFVIYKPKAIIAGDFYWVEEVEGLVIFAVADCTGHGVPGAMVSVVCHTALNRAIREFKLISPNEILVKTREIVKERFQSGTNEISDGMDIALCVWDKKQSKLSYSGAYNSLYLIRKNKLIEYKADKQPIGKFMGDEKPYNIHDIQLQKDDLIYLFSDGYADQFGGEKDKKFSYKRFRELILKNNKLSMDVQKNILSNELENWMQNTEQIDDVCVLGLKV